MLRTVSMIALALSVVALAGAAQGQVTQADATQGMLAQATPAAAPAAAAEGAAPAAPAAAPASPIPLVGACIAAALAVLGGAMGIGRIAAGTVAAISRQPEAAGQMFLAWLLPAAMIEGVTLFGIVLCLLVITR
jgi:F-type H+-transporting ATPase subunit c